eukprot:9474912-Pyramimonas_sp.AAC.1
MKASPDIASYQSLIDSCSRHVVMAHEAKIRLTPKHHLFCHLTLRRWFVGRKGSPFARTGSSLCYLAFGSNLSPSLYISLSLAAFRLPALALRACPRRPKSPRSPPTLCSVGPYRDRTWYYGPPRFYSTWQDESLNFVIRSMAQRSHRQCMEMSIFRAYSLLGSVRPDMPIYGPPWPRASSYDRRA